MLNSPEKSLIWIHNHHGGSIFSIHNLISFNDRETIKTMTIVANTGEVINDKDVEKALRKLYNKGIIEYKVR